MQRQTLSRDVIEHLFTQLDRDCPWLQRIDNTEEYLFALVIFERLKRESSCESTSFITRVFNQLLIDFESKLRKHYKKHKMPDVLFSHVVTEHPELTLEQLTALTDRLRFDAPLDTVMRLQVTNAASKPFV